MSQADLRARWKLSGNCEDELGRSHGIGEGITFGPGPGGDPEGAARFNGIDSRITIGDGPHLRLGSGDFTIACRVRPEGDMKCVYGDILGKFDPVHRTGLTLGMQGSAPAYSGMGNTPYLYFGIDDGYVGPVEDHGKPCGDNALVSNLVVHEDQLYCGIADAAEPERAARVFRWQGGSEWEDCGRIGSDPTVRSAMSLIVHNNELYAGTGTWDWVKCFEQQTETGPTHVFRYQGGTEWEDLGQIGDGTRVLCLASYGGDLYAGIDAVGGGRCFRFDGARWHDCGSPDGRNLECLLPFQGQLHAATHGNVWRHEGGEQWTQIGNDPHGINQIHSMCVFDGSLALGTWPQGYVLRYAGPGEWEIIGRLGLDEERHPCNEVMDLLAHNGKLYAGLIPKAQLYRYESDGNWTLMHSLAGRGDWHEEAVDAWCRITTLTSHRGAIFAATGSCRGREEDVDPDGQLGRVVSMKTGWVTSCERRIDSEWMDVVAQRKGRELTIHVNGTLCGRAEKPGEGYFDIDNGFDLEIGRGAQGSFYGSIADVRIYNGAVDPKNATLP